MATEYTANEKLAKLIIGDFLCPVPPAHTHYWINDDWVRYIDSIGKWRYTDPGELHSALVELGLD